MSCLKISVLALRLASATPDHVTIEPGLSIRTKCGLDIGAVWREHAPVAEIGFRLQPRALPVWLRIGAEADYRRDRQIGGGPSRNGVKRPPRFVIEQAERSFDVRPRVSIGADLRIAGEFFVSPEIEATNGGRAFISVGKAF